MRSNIRVGFAAASIAMLALTVGSANAASAAWVANPGTSYEDGVVTLVNSDSTPLGTSYENSNLEVPVTDDSVITFEWRSDDVTCAGGAPRVFIQGGAYNTFDSDPAGPGACGTGSDWRTVTGDVENITEGFAGHTGIVNDNPSDRGTILVRNLTIDGVAILFDKEQCKEGGFEAAGFKNQGACVSSFASAK